MLELRKVFYVTMMWQQLVGAIFSTSPSWRSTLCEQTTGSAGGQASRPHHTASTTRHSCASPSCSLSSSPWAVSRSPSGSDRDRCPRTLCRPALIQLSCAGMHVTKYIFSNPVSKNYIVVYICQQRYTANRVLVSSLNGRWVLRES